jgi:hypothetical protein
MKECDQLDAIHILIMEAYQVQEEQDDQTCDNHCFDHSFCSLLLAISRG